MAASTGDYSLNLSRLAASSTLRRWLLASLLLHLLASTLHLFMLSNLAIDLLEHEHQRVTVVALDLLHGGAVE
jgi:hypothetical protein